MRLGKKQEEQRETKRSGKINLRILLGVLVFLFGFGVVFYPAVSNLWNRYRQSRLTQSYDRAIEEADTEDLSALWEAAREYNANLTGNLLGDAFEGVLETEDEEAAADDSAGTETLSAAEADTLYQSLLNPAGDGIMGYLSIPKIDVFLPIYHGTGAEELQKGIGHLYGTYLPVGGEGTHTVLAGHRGLPSAALLTDLDLLETGDYFYLYVLDDILAYQVTEIEVVDPEETDSLAARAGEDLATIVTCTPYGVNTQRLLVHGSRVDYVPNMEQEQPQTGQILSLHGYAWMAYGLPAIGILLVLLLALFLRARRRKRQRQGSARGKEKN